MRVLVTWADDSSPNLGVRALGRGSVDVLRRSWPDAEYVWMNYGHRPPEVPFGRRRSLLRERASGRHGMMRWLRGFDLVWDTRSGDSFADIYGLRRHTTMSLVHEFAAQARTPVVLAPQTIGPFGTARGRLVAQRSLHRSRLVFARDPESAEAARALGRPVDATASDLVFGLDQPEPGAPRDVLLNVSGLLWGSSAHVDAEQYRQGVRDLVRRLLADGRAVTLLPHVLDSPNRDNDVPTALALVEEFEGRIDAHVPRDLDDARSAIAGARLVIGARMHACLNALSVGTPAIALAYSRKFAPLMRSIGWEHVVPISGADDIAARASALAGRDGLASEAAAARDRGRELLSAIPERLAEL